MGIARNVPYSNEKLIDYGLEAIRAYGDLTRALEPWEAIPPTDKSWARFKMHIEDQHDLLKNVQGPTLQSSGYRQATQLSDMFDTVTSQNRQVLETLNLVLEKHNTPPSLIPEHANYTQ